MQQLHKLNVTKKEVYKSWLNTKTDKNFQECTKTNKEGKGKLMEVIGEKVKDSKGIVRVLMNTQEGHAVLSLGS